MKQTAKALEGELNHSPLAIREPLKNTFFGGINNLDFQFVDIDADDDYDIFFCKD